MHLYLVRRISLGGEGESTCERQPDDRFSIRFGLSRHFLRRKYSRLHNLPSVRICTNIPRGRRNLQLQPSGVVLITTNLPQHEIMLLTVEKGTLGTMLIQKLYNFFPLKKADQALSLGIVAKRSKVLTKIYTVRHPGEFYQYL